MAQLAPSGLVPGIHIAQFCFQVIGNCGVISLMRRSKGTVSVVRSGQRVHLRELVLQFPVGEVHNMTVSWHWWLASISSAARG